VHLAAKIKQFETAEDAVFNLIYIKSAKIIQSLQMFNFEFHLFHKNLSRKTV